jgi:DNA (cytosine-5)-methyltransferase 1
MCDERKRLKLPKNQVKMVSAPRYIDIFAGCGGLSVGLHLAGWKGLFAIERNPDAFSTLKANLIDDKKHFEWPDWLPLKAWNIQRLLRTKSANLIALRGKVDLVVGGPPCQGFSMAGRRKESDKRNQLIHSYLKFVKIVQPSAILFENVRGFTMKFKSKEGDGIDYSQVVIEELKELGYPDAHGEIINMADYGVPQRRQRFIVIGTRNHLTKNIFARLKRVKKAFLFAKGIPTKNTARAALSDLEKRHGVVPCPDTKGFKSALPPGPQLESRGISGGGKQSRRQTAIAL